MRPDVPSLSPRLAAVAEAIVPGSRVADLGSDHGKLALWLAASGRVAYCLATEKTEARLRRVGRAPAHASWACRLGHRAGDGVAAIHPGDRIDCVVIAGLGGRTIVRILIKAEALGLLPSRLVLQPRSEVASVRRWLSENGWRLISEHITEQSGRFHLTLAALRGDDADVYRDPSLSREDLLNAGPLLLAAPTPALASSWRLERDRFLSILAGPGSGTAFLRARSGLDRAERILAVISMRAG